MVSTVSESTVWLKSFQNMNDAVAMEGDLNLGESANFLNTGPNVV